ncbi:MAG: serine/threonine-protein kinase [Limisphaerales bacterium]
MFFGGSKSSDRHDKGISVPDHELFRLLATGAYGQVWLAKTVLGTFRAVKIVQREKFQHERQYEREFEGVKAFEPHSRSHPGFVHILHVGRDNREGFFCYVMELADDEGGGREVKPVSYRPRTLRSELDRRQRLPVPDCARLALSILSALDHLHQLGLVHRDIKPANFIFVDGQPKFADIGLVAAISGDGTLVGSIGYNAPEGSGCPPADIFSLGRVIFEMFTGVAVAKCGDALPDVSAKLADERERRFLAAVLKACAVRTGDRWRNAAEFYDALAPFAAVAEDPGVGTRDFPKPSKPMPAPAPGAPPPPGDPAGDVATMLEPAGGAVPLKSRFYIERAGDRVLETALARRDGIVRITGARQMGKTSLLARGLQQARQRGWRVVMTDLQKANVASLQSLDAFYAFLGESVADQLDLEKLPRDLWDERRSANANFERWFRREVLGDASKPFLWELDEVDRLFGCAFGPEVFGLFRSWYNDRALNGGAWDQFTLSIAYANEVRLFIPDERQSPFNVGTLIELADFTPAESEEMNRRYGGPLKTPEERARLHALLAGQPFLTRCALNEMVASGAELAVIEAAADREDGLFAEHLRRLEHIVSRHPELPAVVRAALEGRPCGDARAFHRLRAVGVVVGAPEAPRMRCELYARHFRRRGAAG